MSYWEEARQNIFKNNYEGFTAAYEKWTATNLVDGERPHGRNALLQWTTNENKKIIWYLIKKGANPQIALNHAAVSDDIDYIQELLRLGTNPQQTLDWLIERREVGFYTAKGKGEEYLRSLCSVSYAIPIIHNHSSANSAAEEKSISHKNNNYSEASNLQKKSIFSWNTIKAKLTPKSTREDVKTNSL